MNFIFILFSLLAKKLKWACIVAKIKVFPLRKFLTVIFSDDTTKLRCETCEQIVVFVQFRYCFSLNFLQKNQNVQFRFHNAWLQFPLRLCPSQAEQLVINNKKLCTYVI
jgi:hypothetical protein